ncbi:cytochrome P450 4C1-like isoform X2 [Vespa crabro]|uniref:cytochrome P450 4C1-like isoform X2 n=1 Tax=Vespa crabro TaxID=7445 RepID=UPI001F02EACB|nr:cytochrome P450 4C1-like isoform X2 [Vespa crabro]
MFNMINGIPGPKAFPIIGIIGNAHLFIGDTTALFKQILNLGNNCQLSYMDVFVNHSIALMEKLETFVGEELEVFDYVLRCTLNIIYDATLDTQINSLTNPDCKLTGSIKCLMDIAIQRVCKLWLHPNIIFYNITRGKKFHASLAYRDNITNKIIKEKMESMLRSKINRELTAEKLGQKRKILSDFLFELSHEGKVYTEEDTRDKMNTIMIAGSETSAIIISFVLLMFATFTEIQLNHKYDLQL